MLAPLIVVSLDSLIGSNELFNSSLSNATNENKSAVKIEPEEAEHPFQANKKMFPLSQESSEILTLPTMHRQGKITCASSNLRNLNSHGRSIDCLSS